MEYYNYGFVPPFNNQQPVNGYMNMGIMKINNGGVYFVALAPLFSLFLEKMAGSRIAAIILWIFTYILCVLVCKYDKDKILSKCFDTSPLDKYCVLPVAYIAKRNKVTRQGNNCLLLCVIAVIFAILRNGFVSYALIQDESYIVTAQQSYYSDFIETSGIDNYLNPSVEEVLTKSCEGLIWGCEKSGNDVVVTVSGETVVDGKKVTISLSFEMWYDGYKFDGVYIKEVTKNNIKLDEEQITELLNDLYFIYSDDNAVNTNLVEA